MKNYQQKWRLKTLILDNFRSLLPGACNSTRCNGNISDQSIFWYFSREIGQFQFTWTRFGKDKTMRPRVNLSISCRNANISPCLWLQMVTEAPSTLIRFQTKTELFCSGYGYRPHYNAENDHRKRSHSKTLSRVERCENNAFCTRCVVVWTEKRCYLKTVTSSK